MRRPQKRPSPRWRTRVSGVFVPAVIGIALVTIAVWLIAGQTVRIRAGQRDFRAGDQLPLRPGTGDAGGHHGRQRHGRKERHYVQDRGFPGGDGGRQRSWPWIKTGTITSGEPRVTDMIPAEGRDRRRTAVRGLRAGAEEASTRWPGPLLPKPERRGQEAVPGVEDFQALPGNGPCRDNKRRDLSAAAVLRLSAAGRRYQPMRSAGGRKHWPKRERHRFFFSRNGKLAGIIAVADVVREDSPQAVKELQNMGDPCRHAHRRQ